MTITEALKPEAALLIKLGSLIVHYQEMNSGKGHLFDAEAIRGLEADLEVREWFDAMGKGAFLPVRRDWDE